MNSIKTLFSLAILSPLLLGISGCGDNTQQVQNAASIVSAHYDTNPPPRGWKVLSVKAVPKDNTVVAQILVTAGTDVRKIKSVSRMEQLAIAKLACPLMFPELKNALSSHTRIWVELRADNKRLVESICPQ